MAKDRQGSAVSSVCRVDWSGGGLCCLPPPFLPGWVHLALYSKKQLSESVQKRLGLLQYPVDLKAIEKPLSYHKLLLISNIPHHQGPIPFKLLHLCIYLFRQGLNLLVLASRGLGLHGYATVLGSVFSIVVFSRQTCPEGSGLGKAT